MGITKNWSLLPWRKSQNHATVSVNGEDHDDYRSIYDAETGDLAVVGYGRKEKDYYPTLSYGKSGIVKRCEKQGDTRSNANELEYVFTQKIDAEKVAALAKAMKEQLTEKNMLYKLPSNPNLYEMYGWFEVDENSEWVYLVRSMTRRLLAAISVAAHPDLATPKALVSAKSQLAELPMRQEEHGLLRCEGLFQKLSYFKPKEDANLALFHLGFDFLPGMAWDEPETTRMRAELVKNGVMQVFGDGSYEYLEAKQLKHIVKLRVEKGAKFDIDLDEKPCYEIAALMNSFGLKKKPNKAEEEILCRYINRCVMIDAISVMMKYGLVNLLQTYLLANPPIAECVQAMINYAKQKKVTWAAEMLEAYCQDDMEAIHNASDEGVMPITDQFQPPKCPVDFENVSLNKKRNVPAAEKQWNCFAAEMRWLERAVGSDAQRIRMSLQHCKDEVDKIPESAQQQLASLAAYLSTEEIKDFTGKGFALLGFETGTKKELTERICQYGGTVSASAGKDTDYVVINLSDMGKDVSKVAKAIAMNEKNSDMRLVSELTLWRAFNCME